MKCPCCGSDLEKVDRPLISLETNKLLAGAEIVRLTRREAEIMSLLIDRMPVVVPNEMMIRKLWGVAEPDDAYDTVKVYICRLRKKIATCGLRLRTVWGEGHVLEYVNQEARAA